MVRLLLHDFHEVRGGSFAATDGVEVVAHYGDSGAEHHAMTTAAGVIDLSCRSRLVLLGADRQKMLNGQVTNNVKDLSPGEGCYAAIVNAKARMLADANIYALSSELLLDLEPGRGAAVAERLERFIIGEDVQVVDAAAHYGLWSIQGRAATGVIEASRLFEKLPTQPLGWISVTHGDLGEMYLMQQARTGAQGFDLFVPNAALATVGERLVTAAVPFGGRLCGWNALELARIEAGIPRFGVDMDESNLPLEAGLEERAISYTKGCYSGQEVIARIRTYGQVAKALRGLRLGPRQGCLPHRGTKLFKEGRDVGYLTSVAYSPRLGESIALGYVRRECNGPGTELVVGAPEASEWGVIVPLPFVGRLLA